MRVGTKKNGLAGEALPWLVFIVGLIIAPIVFSSSSSMMVLSLITIAIVFALSYNLLFGQTGLLSFGHAVYYGLGAYFTMHAINYCSVHIGFPMELMPLVGGAAGLFFGFVIGIVAVRRAGLSFAMISFGLGILMASLALILRQWFGGDGGLSGDPTRGAHLFGMTLANAHQIYYLLAFWCVVSAVVIRFLSITPLGHMAAAVRDNPERVEFMGFSPYQIRLRMHTIAGCFAGLAGGMAALANGIVTPDALGFLQSSNVLVMTYIGGTSLFFGPVVGAIILSFMQIELSNFTDAWELYIGLLFVLIVIGAPDGLLGLVRIHVPAARHRLLHLLLPGYLLVLIPGAVCLLSVVFIVQMGYALHGTQIFLSQSFTFAGIEFDNHSFVTWGVALLVAVVSFLLCLPGVKRTRLAWGAIADQIKVQKLQMEATR